jgi:hypothetical protein
MAMAVGELSPEVNEKDADALLDKPTAGPKT